MIGANNTVTIDRFVKTDTKKTIRQTVVANVGAYIENDNPQLQAIYSNDPAVIAYKIFVSFFDVEVGDRITDANGLQYDVQQVQKYKNDELDPHTEIVAVNRYRNAIN